MKQPLHQTILDGLAFNAVWLVCAWSASRYPLLGATFAGLAVWVLHYTWGKEKGRMQYAVLFMFLGLAIDIAFGRLGWLSFTTGAGAIYLPPLWLAMLWMMLGFVLPRLLLALAWSAKRLAVMGAILGPFSYAAGHGFGAIVVHHLWVYVILMLLWAALFPLSTVGYTLYQRFLSHEARLRAEQRPVAEDE